MFIERVALQSWELKVDWRAGFALFSKKVVDGEMLSRKSDEIWVTDVAGGWKDLSVQIWRELLDSDFVYSESLF